MFANKLYTYLTCAYLKKQKLFLCEIFDISFSYEDENIGRFSVTLRDYRIKMAKSYYLPIENFLRRFTQLTFNCLS